MGVDVASSGNIYVADTSNYRIQYFTSTGSFLGKWGSRGSGDGQFYNPDGVGFSLDGKVCVADSMNHRVKYHTPSGSLLGM